MYIDKEFLKVTNDYLSSISSINDEMYKCLKPVIKSINDKLNNEVENCKYEYNLLSFLDEYMEDIEVIKYQDAILGKITKYEEYDDRMVIFSGDTELHLFYPYNLYKFNDTNIYNLYRNNQIICQIKLKDK